MATQAEHAQFLKDLAAEVAQISAKIDALKVPPAPVVIDATTPEVDEASAALKAALDAAVAQ